MAARGDCGTANDGGPAAACRSAGPGECPHARPPCESQRRNGAYLNRAARAAGRCGSGSAAPEPVITARCASSHSCRSVAAPGAAATTRPTEPCASGAPDELASLSAARDGGCAPRQSGVASGGRSEAGSHAAKAVVLGRAAGNVQRRPSSECRCHLSYSVVTQRSGHRRTAAASGSLAPTAMTQTTWPPSSWTMTATGHISRGGRASDMGNFDWIGTGDVRAGGSGKLIMRH